jgi:hypothetical protein
MLILFFLLMTMPLVLVGGAWAQDPPAVQEISGLLSPGEAGIFRIAILKYGQTLDAFMENCSGNLDPILFDPVNQNHKG